ncbi:MAG: helix-turn-helix transcriptional regulator [Lachnospiraceae bacterium]|nr:helix-turn-helix transcriptional regulator [Lachnospiraceae bacterium]
MDYLNNNISLNLKKIRLGRGMSLDQAAEQTGVSKSILGQIERGEANPTIGTIGKIVSGLRVELSDLVKNPGEEIYLVKKENLVPTKIMDGKYRVYTYFPYEKNRDFEIYIIEVEPEAEYVSGSHGEKTKEYVLVNEGTLMLKREEESCIVNKGDAIRFDSDEEHRYINAGDTLLQMVCVFSYV